MMLRSDEPRVAVVFFIHISIRAASRKTQQRVGRKYGEMPCGMRLLALQ
jgi:hypothetical protein